MGEVFAGRYELIDPIAMGGMGTVWCVLDRSDDQVKAAKILRQSDAASLLRFVREQSMRIDHLHVVTPQSWAGMDDRVLFTMPLLRGGSVAGLIKQHGALPIRWVALLVDQTLQALEAVHGAGIVHRDVKPANLLLEPTGAARPHLRLTDFGIAAPLDEPRMTRASVVIGSPGYMAPEQWHGADPDFRSDIYSVGRVGQEMLTGVRPSTGSPDAENPPSDTGDPAYDALAALLARATADHPEQRPATAAEMRAELAALQLDSLPPEPGESIFIRDEFADLQVPDPGQTTDTRAAGHTSVLHPDPSMFGSTRVDRRAATHVGHVADGRQAASKVPALLLLLVGLISLVVGGFLLLG